MTKESWIKTEEGVIMNFIDDYITMEAAINELLVLGHDYPSAVKLISEVVHDYVR